MSAFGLVLPAFMLLAYYQSVNANSYDTYSYYLLREECEGTPNRVDSYIAGFFEPYLSCDNTCNDSSSSWKSHNTVCGSTDYTKDISKAFGNSSYLLQEAFESDCETFRGAVGFLASGDCEQVIMFVQEWGFSVYEKIQIEANGDIDAQDTEIQQTLLNSSTCDENGYRWTYYSTTPSNGSSSCSSNVDSLHDTLQPTSGNITGVIAGSVGGGVAAILLLGFTSYRRRASDKQVHGNRESDNELTALANSQHYTMNVAVDSLDRIVLGQSGLWSDDVITAKRISRRHVHVKHLISRGAYGEVYEGIVDDTRVAVKMLLPETRSDISYVNSFLAEAKLSATMNHPNIVTFIAVAWNSLSDLCFVLEFMEGGDLRTLLNKYEESNHPVGINQEKVKIALEVCHALTYLHSLAPPVIHRDLKSRNILLTNDHNAKLTDFGVSRERLDETMTAGVGTSLWMAPEVMLGEHYDDKADMFSFGVVLSELDMHLLPYAQAKEKKLDSNGKRLPDTVLLQHVAMGTVRVEFSESNPQEIIDLGNACVSIDPNQRPTAAEALYTLQVVLAKEFS